MKRFLVILLLVVFLLLQCDARTFAGIFSMDNTSNVNQGQGEMTEEEIPVFFSADKLIQRRHDEARKLIFEGIKLIQKGEKKKDESLIAKGQIKKDIGRKQLEVLKEQVQTRKNETSGF